MLDAQKPNSEWMVTMLAKHRLSATRWAQNARVGKDTVSRAIKPDYAFVTKIGTLVKLADAIGEPPPGAARAIPSVDSVCDIMVELFGIIAPESTPSLEVVHALSQAFRDTLLHLADEQEAAADRRMTQLTARTVAKQLVGVGA